MKNHKKRDWVFEIPYAVGLITLGVALGVTLKFVSAWVEPDAPPPGGNISAPINTSNVDQVKKGGLYLNGWLATDKNIAAKEGIGTNSSIHADQGITSNNNIWAKLDLGADGNVSVGESLFGKNLAVGEFLYTNKGIRAMGVMTINKEMKDDGNGNKVPVEGGGDGSIIAEGNIIATGNVHGDNIVAGKSLIAYGNVGIDGSVNSKNGVHTVGTLTVNKKDGGEGGIITEADIVANGNIHSVGDTNVGKDLRVNGNIWTAGNIIIGDIVFCPVQKDGKFVLEQCN